MTQTMQQTSNQTDLNAPAGAQLRSLLRSEHPLVLPGVFDAISARLAASAGFPALYMSGFGVGACRAALPDDGLLTMTETTDQASAIIDATNLPVLADADTGYGHLGSVARAVRRYEQVGVAGIHIEDLAYPKRGAQVVSRAEMVDRVEAALAARRASSFMIVGRTDSLDELGIEDAVDRARLLAQAGADAVFVHSLTQKGQFKRVRDAVDVPLVASVVEGLTEPTSAAEMEELGYEIVLFPISVLRGTIPRTLELYRELALHGALGVKASSLLALDELDALLRKAHNQGG